MEFNIDPYNDDFQQNALDNNYMRIMFKPGKAVQARELTQIQSILQNQIKQFGDHIFQDGSPVIGGNMTLDNKVTYLKLLESYENADIEIEDFDKALIRNDEGTVQAKVLATYFPSGGNPTLMVRYVTGNVFNDGDTITIAGTSIKAQLILSNATGPGTVVSINEGVFYADGFFVKVADQSAVVSAYSTSANVKIGLEISDTFVDSAVDSTLLDPAQGSFNFQAPGADRYQFNLVLSTRPIDTVVDESRFFELMRVENGAITKQVKYPVYSELEKTLARRTFDESGDYTVKPFRASILDGSDSNNYTLMIEPGKAYVKGFEFETIGTLKLDAPKPRTASDVKSLVDTDVDISYGNYVYVTALRGSGNGFINIAALEKVDVHCVDTSNVAVGLGTTANSHIYQNTRIGSVRVKNFIRSSADAFDAVRDSNGIFSLYMTDIQMDPKVVKVTGASSNANTVRFRDGMSAKDNAYRNVSVTILPVRLDAVQDVLANVFQNQYTVNANNNGTFASKVSVGDVIRIGDQVREVVNVSGGNLTVNTEFTKTMIQSASNPVYVLVQNAYTQNVATQTRTISRYDGTTKTAFLDTPFDNNGIADAQSVVQLDFHMEHAESFIAGPSVSNVGLAIANASMNVSIQSQYATGETVVEEKLKNSLIFKLPGTYTKRASLQNADYVYNKIFLNQTFTANQLTIAQGSGLVTGFETIPFADTTASIKENLIVIVRDNNNNTNYPNGTILQLTSANVAIPNTNAITIDTYVPDIQKADIIMSVKENNAEQKIRQKNFFSNTAYSSESANFTYPTSNTNANVEVSIPNFNHVASIDVANGLVFLSNTQFNTVRPGDSISLFIPDVVKVRKILSGNTTNYPDANNVRDITDSFYIDYGQRDEIYDHAKITLKEGYDSPNAKLLVHVDFYQHIYIAGSNVSFFSVDSYPQSQYETGSIPIYTASTGSTYYLRDCLDFRPTRPIGDTSSSYVVSNLPSPNEVTELSLQYYLPRIDKLVLSKDKEFRIVQGKSAPQPLPPEDRDDAMTLYNIYMPAYVADIRDVKLKYVENRRFTMKDISSIEKRLQKVEYFTSLNNVEKLAMSDKTQYEDGTEKEKYGIVGENFTNFNIANYKTRDFGVALEGGFMLPVMKITPLGFSDIVNSNTTKNKKTVCLEYTETPAIKQGLASNKGVGVQPFLFGQFNGTVSLTPDTDYWVADNLKPEVISVPERIVETQSVIREVTVERYVPPTLPPPTSNASTVIITSPSSDPPANTTATVVVTPPSDPPPIIPSKPIIDIDYPPPQPYVPPEPILPVISPSDWGWGVLGFDSWDWWGNLGLFGFGGFGGGDNLWIPSVPPILTYETPNIVQSPTPVDTTPINVAGGGYRNPMDEYSAGLGDFDYGAWNNFER